MNNKNIIIISDRGINTGGVSVIAINAAIALSKKNNVTFVSGTDEICDELKKSNINVISLGLNHIGLTNNPVSLMRGIWNRKTYKKIKSILKNYDNLNTKIFIHSWTKCLSSSVFKAVAKMKFKTYVTLHDYFLICPNGGLYNYKKNRICEKKPCSLKCYLCNCDKKNYLIKLYRVIRQSVQNHTIKKYKPNLLFVSNFSKNVINKLTEEKYNGIVLKNFVDFSNDYKVDICKNDKYLFLGRISDEKGIDIFCEAVTKNKCEAIVIGDGPLLEKYKKEYQNIDFVGWKTKSEIAEICKNVRAIIITSKLMETMGLTVLEMQELAIPSIVPIHFAGSEFVNDKVDGIYYDSNNLESLDNAIKLSKDDKIMKKINENLKEKNIRGEYSILQYVKKIDRFMSE